MARDHDDGRKADATHTTGFASARRKNERKPIALAVELTGRDGTVCRGRTANLSIGGAFIVTPSPPPYGTALTLVFALPGDSCPALIEATVRWADSSGVGVQFGLMGAKVTNALIELLRR